MCCSSSILKSFRLNSLISGPAGGKAALAHPSLQPPWCPWAKHKTRNSSRGASCFSTDQWVWTSVMFLLSETTMLKSSWSNAQRKSFLSLVRCHQRSSAAPVTTRRCQTLNTPLHHWRRTRQYRISYGVSWCRAPSWRGNMMGEWCRKLNLSSPTEGINVFYSLTSDCLWIFSVASSNRAESVWRVV